VEEIIARGPKVIYFATELYRNRIEAAGAEFRAYTAISDDYFEARGLHGGVPQKVARSMLASAEQMLPELLAITRDESPDCIIYDGMCPWGYLTAKIMKLPAIASLALLPPVSPPPRAMLNAQMISLLLPMIFQDFSQVIEANRIMHALAKRYGIPATPWSSILNAPGDLAISYTSSYFQPYADTVSDTVRFVGWRLNESSEAFPEIAGLRDRRLIYVSLGTINNKVKSFFDVCIEAFSGLDAFVLMSTGNGIEPGSFGKLPDNIAILPWVPQAEVLKRASLFVTHGGLNSLHDGLYCGVPLLLVPQQPEQTMNAMRVVELGAGLIMNRKKLSVNQLKALATHLLEETSFKTEALRVGDSLRMDDALSRAVTEIENMTS
jgi:MGT family glycosyltransferase